MDDLMVDPWSGKPLQFEPAGAGAVEADERSMKSMDATNSILTESSTTATPGLELRRFTFVANRPDLTRTETDASPVFLERDPMERTTSPVPYESKKQMPEWRDEDFEAPSPGGGHHRRARVTFATVAAAGGNVTPGSRSMTPVSSSER